MARTKFKSLQYKLMMHVVSLALILAFAVSVLSYYSELKRSASQTENMLNQLLDTVEDTAAIAAYSNNTQIAQDVINGLLKNDIVYKVELIGNDGFRVLQDKPKISSDSTIHKSKVSRLLKSPFGDIEIIGQLIIEPTAQYSLVQAEHSALMNAMSSMTLIATTSLIILLVIRTNLSKPLSFVSNTLHDIKTGEKKRIPQLKRNINDELGRLIIDINNLLTTLETKFNEERALRKKVESIESQLRQIFDSTSAGLFLLDTQGNLLTYNSTLQHILKIPEQEESGAQRLLKLCEYFNESDTFTSFTKKALESGQLESEDFTLKIVRENQNPTPVWLHCLVSQVFDNQGQERIEGVVFDITKRVEAEIEIRQQIDYDSLTGLLRRQAAKAAYENYLNNHPEPDLCFLLLDLDGFKEANDTFGHLAGDQVLMITAERLSNSIRSSDIACRLGGDEFLIILFNCMPEDLKYKVANKIVTSIQNPMSVEKNIIINVGISIGLAIYREGMDFESLLDEADQAMYEVKRKGKNGYAYFDQGKYVVNLTRSETESKVQNFND